MRFLAPGFALLVVLGAVPVLIHLLGRPRAERRPFPALRFLLASDRRLASRNRLRERLLLVARALAMVTIPLLLARPFVELRAATSGLGGLGAVESAVIVVDDSRSLGYVASGAPLFDRVRDQARRIVDGIGRGSEATIVLCSGALQAGEGQPLPELTPDRERLRQAVAQLRPSHRDGDTTAALRRAATLLATSTHRRRRVYLLSDFAAHGFEGEPPWAEGAGPELVPVDVRPQPSSTAAPNRAITQVKSEPAPQLGPRGVRITVEVANFGAETVKDVPVTLRLDGKAVAKGLVDLPPAGRVVKRFLHAFPPGPSPSTAPTPAGGRRPDAIVHDGEVLLAPDALPDDDARYFRVSDGRSVRVLLVDGDPRTGVRRDDELFYLETALESAGAGDADDARFEVTVALPDDLARRERLLDGADVVFFANAKAPDAKVAAALRAFVERGGGLFLSVGANVDPDAWNAALGDLLPEPLATLRTVGTTLDSRADGEARTGGPGERLGRFDGKHPVLAPFVAGGGSSTMMRAHGPAEGLREARVGRLALLRPTAGGQDERRVLLRLEGGAPLLVEGTRGEGRVLLLTTTIDRDWSDLAIQPAYLPLVQQAARYLAGATLREPERPGLVGAPHAVPLEGSDRRVEVTAPSGRVRRFDAERLEGRRLLDVASTDEPGLYRVAVATRDDALRPRPSLDFAVNVDPRESDLAPIDPARLAPLERPSATGSDESPRHRLELWHALGAVLLLLLLAESVLATRRGWRLGAR